MTDTELKELDRLMDPNTPQDLTDIFKIYKEFLFKVMMNHKNESNTSVQNRQAILLLQMMFSKIANIEKLVEGIEFTSSTGARLNKVTDPILISSSIRGVFESVGMFNIVYVNPKTEDKRLILHTLWVLAGLNFRQRFNSVTKSLEFLEKSKAEKEKIDKLTKDIEETDLFKSLKPKDKDKIYNAINGKHYYIMFVDNEVKGLGGFQELIDNAGVVTNSIGQLYTYYSLSSHPSNVSVFQFGGMFETDNTDNFDNVNFNLSNAFKLVGVFIADYIKVFPFVSVMLESQSEIDRIVIKLNNSIIRGRENLIQ
ncbi:hypothetical protein H7F33_11920 [Pedobacter sp. PAMC26386]|nr:hypothetical protein H7F33_11920 [Pedobacter sp. PAMC26386]